MNLQIPQNPSLLQVVIFAFVGYGIGYFLTDYLQNDKLIKELIDLGVVVD